MKQLAAAKNAGTGMQPTEPRPKPRNIAQRKPGPISMGSGGGEIMSGASDPSGLRDVMAKLAAVKSSLDVGKRNVPGRQMQKTTSRGINTGKYT